MSESFPYEVYQYLPDVWYCMTCHTKRVHRESIVKDSHEVCAHYLGPRRRQYLPCRKLQQKPIPNHRSASEETRQQSEFDLDQSHCNGTASPSIILESTVFIIPGRCRIMIPLVQVCKPKALLQPVLSSQVMFQQHFAELGDGFVRFQATSHCVSTILNLIPNSLANTKTECQDSSFRTYSQVMAAALTRQAGLRRVSEKRDPSSTSSPSVATATHDMHFFLVHNQTSPPFEPRRLLLQKCEIIIPKFRR